MTEIAPILFPEISWLEKILRPVAVYAVLLVYIHWAGKRELAQVNNFDFVVLLLISNVVQNATIGDDNSLLGGLVGAFALIAVNQLVVRVLFRHKTVERLLEGQPTPLIRDGQILTENLDREEISEEELLASLRRQGVADPGEVAQATLETGGAISVVQRRPTGAEQYQAEVLARLEALAAEVRALRRAGPAA